MARFCIRCAHEGRGHSGDYAYRRYIEQSEQSRPRRV
jgi:hypothetical protein